MLRIAILALIGLPSLVGAQQRPAYVAAFNGYYLEIGLSSSGSPTDFGPAEKKAEQICSSVGKSPELQFYETIAKYRFMLFYVCI